MARGNNGTRRPKPNLLITGTPGTGKSTTASALAEATNLRYICVGDLVKEKNLHDGWDNEFGCHIINEDLVCDELEDVMVEGGNIVDYHGCDFFPQRWFDRVVVLRTENSIFCFVTLAGSDCVLNQSRGYSGTKLSNNLECELYQILLEEACDSYEEEIVTALQSVRQNDSTRAIATEKSAESFCLTVFPTGLLVLRSFSSVASKTLLKVGDVLRETRVFSSEDVKAYAEVSHDWNPLHFDPESARKAGFENRLVHGMLVSSMFPRIISAQFPGAVYVSQSLHFRSPVYVGDEILGLVQATALRETKNKYIVKFSTKCFENHNELVVIDGEATAILPNLEMLHNLKS
ncbi:hypothetical protein ARALYDRAFT_496171 [Arabidopsis lyrata subsp. lyrata]|uniref:Adenylate kinase isoenzyme 6 homolog n=1 Tax=Arabidopsis lyrata subsp. lyrata TaxID=81972 RepID=D7MTT8_ARALL|nr:hypothetical protein ARALYDRAFT_496171 [Arabidopsis lyrata subsp. lyrata]